MIFRDGCANFDGDEEMIIVGEAQNGTECTSCSLNSSPIFFCSICVCRTDGLATRRSHLDQLPTRVIVLTAAEDDRDVVRAMRLGARGVVQTVRHRLSQEHPACMPAKYGSTIA
jgi:DNA-binding NarL/FixJ family response regulator